jgi:dGTPase
MQNVTAPYASDPAQTRGRLHPEAESAHRSPFQRDRDRIIHSSAFRRLKHKTQVFVEHEGDYYRTRLTHSIEVAQVARTISRTLGLNEDLTEAVALAHDLGHTPFGHTGEDALQDCMAPYGGFDHNAHSLRIVTALENHYAEFDGLNLSWETLEGIAKHNGPLLNAPGSPAGLHYALAEYVARHDLELHTHAGAEAQVAALSDDIAYNNHDLDDGLRAGLFSEAEIRELPMIGACFAEVEAKYPGVDPVRLRHEALRRVFGMMVEDVIRESRRLLEGSGAGSAEDIRMLGRQVIRFSPRMWQDLNVIRKFFFAHMYRHWRVQRIRRMAGEVVREMFAIFMERPGTLPDEWRRAANRAGSDEARARVVADYIAGMTDRFAIEEHKQLTNLSARG